MVLLSDSMCILASGKKFAPSLRHDRADNVLTLFGRSKIDADAAALSSFWAILIFGYGLAYFLLGHGRVLGRGHATHADQIGQGSEQAEHSAAGKNVDRHELVLTMTAEGCRARDPAAEDISLRDQLFLRRRHMPQNNVVMRHLNSRMPGVELERDVVDLFTRS